MYTIALVLFVVFMAMWAASPFAGEPMRPRAQHWLAWICVLILGLVVFLIGSGMMERGAVR